MKQVFAIRRDAERKSQVVMVRSSEGWAVWLKQGDCYIGAAVWCHQEKSYQPVLFCFSWQTSVSYQPVLFCVECINVRLIWICWMPLKLNWLTFRALALRQSEDGVIFCFSLTIIFCILPTCSLLLLFNKLLLFLQKISHERLEKKSGTTLTLLGVLHECMQDICYWLSPRGHVTTKSP